MDLDDLVHAQTAVGGALTSLEPDAWQRPSPCEGWDVAHVTRHLIVGERAFATSLRGQLYDLPSLQADVDGIDPADLPAAYVAGADKLRTALAAADPSAAFPTGLGPMPAPAIAELRTIEALVHGWDIARGGGVVLEIERRHRRAGPHPQHGAHGAAPARAHPVRAAPAGRRNGARPGPARRPPRAGRRLTHTPSPAMDFCRGRGHIS